MPLRLRLFFSILTGTLLLIPALALYRELSMRPDIWWTPPAMALSLDEGHDRVRIFARGKPLKALLEARQLWIREEAGSSTLDARDVGLRFNNWDRVRAARIPMLLTYSAACGAGVVLLLLIATGRLAYRGEKVSRFAVLTLLALLSAVRPASAQGRLALALAAGPSPYDLSGTGTGTAVGGFLPWRPARGLVVEPGLTVFSYLSQFDERTTLMLPEVSIQGELVLGQFRPFLGGGAGGSFALSGVPTTTLTLHAVGGARVDLGSTWGLLGEMRIRSVHPWTGNTVDFLFGVSRALQPYPAAPGPVTVPVAPVPVQPGRFDLSGHLGVHVDHNAEADRAISDGTSAIYAAGGEATAWSGRLGYWVQPTLGLQFDISHSSNASYEGSTSVAAPDLVNRTTYLSARGMIRTSPARSFGVYAAAGPALMVYGGTGENLRTSDVDFGGVLDVGARLRAASWLQVQLSLSNYLYSSEYQTEGQVFRHDLLILPGLVYTWR